MGPYKQVHVVGAGECESEHFQNRSMNPAFFSIPWFPECVSVTYLGKTWQEEGSAEVLVLPSLPRSTTLICVNICSGIGEVVRPENIREPRAW